MSGNTAGKGPFAKRSRPSPPNYEAPRWSAPLVALSSKSISALTTFVDQRNDVGTTNFLNQLVLIEPQFRLARNLSVALRLLASNAIADVLCGGFSTRENAFLIQLEAWGIPVELLGVAHALLNVRERQELLVHFNYTFIQARVETT